MGRNDFFVLAISVARRSASVQRVAVDRCFGLGLHIFSRMVFYTRSTVREEGVRTEGETAMYRV